MQAFHLTLLFSSLWHSSEQMSLIGYPCLIPGQSVVEETGLELMSPIGMTYRKPTYYQVAASSGNTRSLTIVTLPER